MGDTFSVSKLREAIGFMREHGEFRPAAIVIDDFPFDKVDEGDLAALREIARDTDAELWMSAVTSREEATDSDGVPESVARYGDAIDVILRMAHDTRAVHVSLLKDHDNPDVSDLKLALDPTTMLLIQER